MQKLALDSLKMGADEYRQLREEHNEDGALDELQRRSLEKGLTSYNLKALRESLLRDQTIASRTHHEWQPPEVRDIFCRIVITEERDTTSSREIYKPF